VTHGSFFTGIGGFDLVAESCGIENLFQVEIDKFCNKVLEKNFPDVKKYRDIKEFDGTRYRGTIDIISGGFPCQPFSIAGKRKGREDERALFPELLRCIAEIQPRWCILENVCGFINIQNGEYAEEAFTSLENEGYKIQPFIIPASAVGAPHRRDRIWIIANANNNGLQRSIQPHKSKRAQSYDQQLSRCSREWNRNPFEVATELCRMDARIPNRVDRLKSLGNSIVPQVAKVIFETILETENKLRGINGTIQ